MHLSNRDETGSMRHRQVIAILCAAGFLLGQPPASAQTFRTYHCRDGSEFVVAFYTGDKTAHVQLDGKAMALRKRLAVSGSRWTKGDITLRMTKTGHNAPAREANDGLQRRVTACGPLAAAAQTELCSLSAAKRSERPGMDAKAPRRRGRSATEIRR